MVTGSGPVPRNRPDPIATVHLATPRIDKGGKMIIHHTLIIMYITIVYYDFNGDHKIAYWDDKTLSTKSLFYDISF